MPVAETYCFWCEANGSVCQTTEMYLLRGVAKAAPTCRVLFTHRCFKDDFSTLPAVFLGRELSTTTFLGFSWGGNRCLQYWWRRSSREQELSFRGTTKAFTASPKTSSCIPTTAASSKPSNSSSC